MAIQEKTVFTIVLCAIILALLAVVFFVLPKQPPTTSEATTVNVNTSQYSNSSETPLSNSTGNPTLNQTENVSKNRPCRLIEFYGQGCPHCANMAPIVAQVENETGVTFDKLEVWYNSTNQQIFESYNVSIQRDCGVSGVPTFMSLETNNSICGEHSESDLKYFVASNCGVS